MNNPLPPNETHFHHNPPHFIMLLSHCAGLARRTGAAGSSRVARAARACVSTSSISAWCGAARRPASSCLGVPAAPFSTSGDARFSAISDDQPQPQAFIVRHSPLDDRAAAAGGGEGEVGGDGAQDRRFAVVALAGSQFKVTVDDIVTLSTSIEADVGETVQFDDVLLVGSAKETVVGRPMVSGAHVTMAIEEKKKEKKVIVFKKRRRKGYQRKNGDRRHVTALRVVDISY